MKSHRVVAEVDNRRTTKTGVAKESIEERDGNPTRYSGFIT
jgi:hypothetical protein